MRNRVLPALLSMALVVCLGGMYLWSGMGGMAGAKTCQSGNTIKYDNCKSCPNLGKYTSCPACSVCTYEECSNKYYVTGCASGCTDLCSDC